MATITEVKGLRNLLNKLNALVAKARRDEWASVSVGYTQHYAIYVHERLDLHHPVGKAKYLTDPSLTLKPELADIVHRSLARGQTLAQALLQAGLRLQRESQKQVPVDTGALKASAYTRLDNAAPPIQ